MYKITEVFASVQGEGSMMGVPAVFVRMAGCGVKCAFCDEWKKEKEAKEIKGVDLIYEIDLTAAKNFHNRTTRRVIFTGGEPLEQEIYPLVKYLAFEGWWVGIETNGMHNLGDLAEFVDHVSMSPKTDPENLKLRSCTDLKILYPYITDYRTGGITEKKITAELFNPPSIRARYRFIQPLWGAVAPQEVLREVVRLGGQWRLGPQVHKYLGLR